MRWKWDQGRLDYFEFDAIRGMARALKPLDGTSMASGDPLRDPLERGTGLPFSPPHYTLWRNYGRTIQCGLLAARVRNRLRITDVCSRLAKGAMGPDEYFVLLARRFYLPSPIFKGYRLTPARQFPLCAVVRLLLSRADVGTEPSVTLDEVFSLVVANNCRGTEPLAFYSALSPARYAPAEDEKRQVREMLIVFSQFSYLKWFANSLYLDLNAEDAAEIASLTAQFTPEEIGGLADRAHEVLRLGSLGTELEIPQPIPTHESEADILFTEGKKVRRTHLRTERNRGLRKRFFARVDAPTTCDVCGATLSGGEGRYPWTENLLHVHHVLPLASPLRIGEKGTSITDLAAVCPNCHDAAHAYYRTWLDERGLDDFPTREDARRVYEEAKRAFRDV